MSPSAIGGPALRRSYLVLGFLALAVAWLALSGSAVRASSFEFSGSNSISGWIHSDRNDSDVSYNLRWQPIKLNSGGQNWYFGLKEFNLNQALGGVPEALRQQVINGNLTGGTFNASGGVQFQVANPDKDVSNKFFPGGTNTGKNIYNPAESELGLQGTFNLSSITFAAQGDEITLTGTLTIDPLSAVHQDFKDMGDNVPLAITVHRVSSGKGADNFITKYVEFADKGRGEVNFKGTTGTGGTPGGGGGGVVPEPGSMLLLGSGLLGLAGWRLRSRRRRGDGGA